MSTNWPWPAPADDGAAAHLVPGRPLPDLAVPLTDGRSLRLARLGHGRLVIFVYTWTGRPGIANPPGWDGIAGAHGSTPQAQGFANLYDAFRALDCDVVGMSNQTTAWQREFADRLKLPFPLASDEAGTVCAALSLPTFKAGDETYLKRLTIAARDGLIEHVWYPVHPPDVHAREVLAWISATADYATEARPRR